MCRTDARTAIDKWGKFRLKWRPCIVIQLVLFARVNLVEFESEDYPSEKLIACQNPLIAEKNQKQTEALFFTIQ